MEADEGRRAATDASRLAFIGEANVDRAPVDFIRRASSQLASVRGDDPRANTLIESASQRGRLVQGEGAGGLRRGAQVRTRSEATEGKAPRRVLPRNNASFEPV